MEWVQVFAIIFSIVGLFMWTRSEGSSDRRETQNIIREDRKDLLEMVKSIQDEIKDFHNRLIEIEKRR